LDDGGEEGEWAVRLRLRMETNDFKADIMADRVYRRAESGRRRKRGKSVEYKDCRMEPDRGVEWKRMIGVSVCGLAAI